MIPYAAKHLATACVGIWLDSSFLRAHCLEHKIYSLQGRILEMCGGKLVSRSWAIHGCNEIQKGSFPK